MKQKGRAHMPQVAILLEASQGISRLMLIGILNYVRIYGPWSLHISGGGPRDVKMPDLRHWHGTGIIGRITSDDVARDILAARLPTVLINPDDAYRAPSHPLSACCRTQSDSPAIGRLAAEYFLGKGFSRFGFIGDVHGVHWSVCREHAFTARLREAGRTCQVYTPPSARHADWSAERTRLSAWLEKLPKPIALFAANDQRARHVLDACLVADIAVPYEAAVLGVNDDLLICETCIPPLSSIALDAEKAGYEAARMLDECMRHPSQKARVFQYGPREVVSRASTEPLQVGNKLVIRALEFIRINGGLTIRVSDVAAHLDVSPRWVERHFRQTLGFSVHEAIQRARMSAVCAMLKETELPLNALSKKCGFAHPNHLCALFKRQFGVTMSDYRRRYGRAEASNSAFK